MQIHFLPTRVRLCDHGAGGGGLVLPGRRQDTDGLVVTGETVDTRLDENEAELGVLVLAVALKMLADGDGLTIVLIEAKEEAGCDGSGKLYLLDQHVQILGHLRSEACHLNHSVSLDHTEA